MKRLAVRKEEMKDELTPREHRILELRFGGLTLTEVSRVFCVTRERVREVEALALSKLGEYELSPFFERIALSGAAGIHTPNPFVGR